MDFQVMLDKLMRLVRGDTAVYDEVKNDPQHTLPALITAVVSVLLFGFGGYLWWVFKDYPDGGDIFTKSFLLGSIFAIALWFAWVFVTYFMLTSMYRVAADPQVLIRTMGYAMFPLALGLLMLIPVVGFGLGVAAVAIAFASTTIAVQMTTNSTLSNALMANGIGFAVWSLALSLISAMGDDPFGPGIYLWNSIADR